MKEVLVKLGNNRETIVHVGDNVRSVLIPAEECDPKLMAFQGLDELTAELNVDLHPILEFSHKGEFDAEGREIFT